MLQVSEMDPSTVRQIIDVFQALMTIALPIFGTYMIAKLNRVQTTQAQMTEKQAVIETKQEEIHTLVNSTATQQREMIASLRGELAAKENIPGVYERVVEVERLLHEQNVTTAATPTPTVGTTAVASGGLVDAPESASGVAMPVKIVGQDETLPVEVVKPTPNPTPPRKKG